MREIGDDSEIGILVVEKMKFIRRTFDEQISLVLNETPQLKDFDNKNIIQMMQLRNKKAFDALEEKHSWLVGTSSAFGYHLFDDPISADYKRMEINTWRLYYR